MTSPASVINRVCGPLSRLGDWLDCFAYLRRKQRSLEYEYGCLGIYRHRHSCIATSLAIQIQALRPSWDNNLLCNMSFGWSASDIVLALRVLYKVRCALKEAGGASSTFQEASGFLDGLQKTMDHLRMFTSTTLTEARLVELRAQVTLVKAPVEKFIEDVKKFEPALGAASSRGKLLSGPRKVQWAFQMPGKIKKLQDSVMVPMMNLSLLLNLNIL